MKSHEGWRGHGPWEPWFAWFPLMINGQSVWLQTVERRYQYREAGGAVERRWMYQLLPDSEKSAAADRRA